MVSYYNPLVLLTVRVRTQSHIVGVVLLAIVVLLNVRVQTQSHVVGVVLLTVVDYMLIT